MGAPARVLSAAVALAAAVAVCVLLRERDRRLRRVAASERLMAGRVYADNAALRREVDRFRRRLDPLLAPPAPGPVGLVADDVVRSDPISAPLEGGPR